MKNIKINKNLILVIIQTIVSSAALFFIYKKALNVIGPKSFGMWSIIISISSLSKLSDFGFSASVVKYVSQLIARGNEEMACATICTAFLASALSVGILSIISFPIFVHFFHYIFSSEYISEAILLLPVSLFSAWLGSLASISLSSLDGCQRFDFRVYLSIISTIILIFFSFILLENEGLIGLIYAQIIQALAIITGGFILLSKVFPTLKLRDSMPSFIIFKKLLKYGASFQVGSIFMMLIDPITKSLMGKFGGLVETSYYEMATRIVGQLRLFVVSGIQLIVPKIAEFKEKSPNRIKSFYFNSVNITAVLSISIFTLIILASPLISLLWVGTEEFSFIIYIIILAFSNCINVITTPAYFTNLGLGLLRWNTASFIAISALNLFFGFLLGSAFGGYGVVLSFSLSLIIGSLIVATGYHLSSNLKINILFTKNTISVIRISAYSLIIFLFIFLFMESYISFFYRSILCISISIGIFLFLKEYIRSKEIIFT
jgi:O-antigen/teichoic acid export membrane protein